MGFIYKITNTINNKCYIGQTKVADPNKRWIGHKNAIKAGAGCPLLQDAVNKYGIDKFSFRVLIICFDEDLNKFEKEYIKKYNSFGENGYNASAGGEPGGTFKGHTHTKENRELFSRINIEYGSRPEVKEHRRNLMLKRYADQEERKKHGEIMRKVWENRKANGTEYVPTKEHCEKISIALKGKICPITNTIINEGSWTEDRKEKHSYIMTKINGRAIKQYSANGTFIAEFETIKLAAKQLNLNRKAINSAAVGRTKTSGGFIWKYANQEPKDLT